MLRRSKLLIVAAFFLVAMILAAAPLYARNPLSERIWSDRGPGRGWHHPPPPPPGSPGPEGGRPPHHDWNPHKGHDKNAPSDKGPTYRHQGVPIGVFPKPEVRNRYEAVEVWRNEDEVMPADQQRWPRERPVAKSEEKFKLKAEWMEQQVVANYPGHPLVDETFVMIKTGAQTQWARMPWHIYTTFTKIKHFALYSDQSGSIAGYEIIDILADMPADIVKEKEEFKRYKLTHQMVDEHWSWDGAELNDNGGWYLDKYKNMPMLYHAYRTMPDAKWYFFIDDDTYVFWDNVYHLLEQYNSTQPLYIGKAASLTPPYPFAHGGSGVILSQGAMALLFDHSDQQVQNMLDHYAQVGAKVCCGDYVVAEALGDRGVLLEKLGYDKLMQDGGPFNGDGIWNYIHVPGMFSTRPITLHHVDAHQAEVLYEYEKLRGNSGPLTAAEFYRDFVLPHITVERRNWIMAHSKKSYERKEDQDPDKGTNAPLKDGDKPLFPWRNKADCRRACELDDKCLQWTQGNDICKIDTKGISLGRAMNQYKSKLKAKDQGTHYTGWMIDRIRHLRAQDKADPLQYDKETNSWNDDENTSEGWYLRQLKNEFYTPYEKGVAAVLE